MEQAPVGQHRPQHRHHRMLVAVRLAGQDGGLADRDDLVPQRVDVVLVLARIDKRLRRSGRDRDHAFRREERQDLVDLNILAGSGCAATQEADRELPQEPAAPCDIGAADRRALADQAHPVDEALHVGQQRFALGDALTRHPQARALDVTLSLQNDELRLPRCGRTLLSPLQLGRRSGEHALHQLERDPGRLRRGPNDRVGARLRIFLGGDVGQQRLEARLVTRGQRFRAIA